MAYDSSNVFAKILRGELPCNKVYEDEFALAFHDISPDAPVHVLVIPKGEYISFDDFMQNAPKDSILGFFNGVHKVSVMLGMPDKGYRLISNHGAAAAQSVPHFHIHLLSGKNLGRLLP